MSDVHPLSPDPSQPWRVRVAPTSRPPRSWLRALGLRELGRSLLPSIAGPLLLTGCTPGGSLDDLVEEDSEERGEALTAAQKRPRYEQMRDALRSRGITKNGYLFAGIANTETGLVMCWSEATWACKGPTSPDCGGGPVIAGAGDGPCSIQQGGLGLFQFDAGTFDQTLALYGSDVLTVDGQMSHAVDYVVQMVKDSVYTTNAETDAKALAWINAFDPNDATLRDQWIKTVLRYYNGCQPSWSCWGPRYATYTDGMKLAISEPGGLAFWADGGKATVPSTEGSQAFLVPQQQHFFRRDTAGNVRHHFWDGSKNKLLADTWGSGAAGQPVAFVHGTSQHTFARKTDGSLGHWFWDPANGLRSDGWAPAGSLAGDPAALVIGEYEAVWAVDGGGQLQHWYWGPKTNGVKHDTWGSGATGRPSVLLTASGEQHAFARGVAGALEHWWWAPGGVGVDHDTWGSGLAGDPVALAIGDFQSVWGVDEQGDLEQWYWGPSTGGVKTAKWGSGVVGRPSAFLTPSGEQHVFARGKTGTVEHWWWAPSSSGIQHDTWGSGIAQDPTAMLVGSQQHVWAVSTSGNVLHWFWDPASSSLKHDSWGK